MREFGVVLGGLGLIRPIPRLGLGRRARCADAFADRSRAFDALGAAAAKPPLPSSVMMPLQAVVMGAAASAKVCAEAYRTAALNAGVTLD
jgi:hypothetical protein